MTHILHSAFFFTVSVSLYIKIPQSNFVILISILQLQLIPNKKEKRKTKQLTSYSLRSPFTSTKTNNPTTPKPSESPSFSPNPIPTSPLHSYLLYLISLSLSPPHVYTYLPQQQQHHSAARLRAHKSSSLRRTKKHTEPVEISRRDCHRAFTHTYIRILGACWRGARSPLLLFILTYIYT